MPGPMCDQDRAMVTEREYAASQGGCMGGSVAGEQFDISDTAPAPPREPIVIPQQLIDAGCRFVKIRRGEKAGSERGWQKPGGANYSHDDEKFQYWITRRGQNYGVLCSDILLVIDADSLEIEEIARSFPATFAVQTGGGGKHFYYRTSGAYTVPLEKDRANVGHLRGGGAMVVGPGSIHPSGNTYHVVQDVPIAEVDFQLVLDAFSAYMEREKKPLIPPTVHRDRQPQGDDWISRLTLSDVGCYPDDVTRTTANGEVQGSHPIHRSNTGHNFCINERENVWYCHRCGSGGGPLLWLAVAEGIIPCADARPGSLRGDMFQRVVARAEEMGLKPPDRKKILEDRIKRGALRWEKSRNEKTNDVENGREELKRVALYFRSFSGQKSLSDTEIIKRLTTIQKNALVNPISDDEILSIVQQSRQEIKELWDLRKRQQKTQTSEIDTGIREKALAILQDPNKNVLDYLKDDLHRSHVGDPYVADTLYASIGSMMCKNTSGVHPGLGGRSGEGKSHIARTVLHQLPDSCKKVGRRSDMALFYSEYSPGTVVFFDDAKNISETMQDIIKQATTEYQQDYVHEVVSIDRQGTDKLFIRKRTSWWLTVADPSFNIQFLNRQLNASVDGSEKQDEEIHQKQLDRAESGAPEFPEDEQTQIIRAMFHILLRENQPVNVIIPFAKRIRWQNKHSRTNFPKFIDTIRAFAALNVYRRKRDEHGNVIAELEDYQRAQELWSMIGREQSKLTKQELLVWSVTCDLLRQHPEGVLRIDLASDRRLRDLTPGELTFALHGRKKQDGTHEGGIENKIPGLTIDKVVDSVKYSDGSRRSKPIEIIKYTGEFSFLDQYSAIVSLDPESEDQTPQPDQEHTD